jgi:hypothetical protein
VNKLVLETALGPYYCSNLNSGSTAPGANSREDFFWKCHEGSDHVFIGSPRELLRGLDGGNPNPCKVCKNSEYGRGIEGVYVSITTPTLAIRSRSEPSVVEVLNRLDPVLNHESVAFDLPSNTTSDLLWRCPAGPDHVYSRSYSHESEGRECSICSNSSSGISNSLATYCHLTGFTRPIHEWHPILNVTRGTSQLEGSTLWPFDVTLVHRPGIFWKNELFPDHVFNSPVRERIHNFREITPAITQQIEESGMPLDLRRNLIGRMSGNRSSRTMSIVNAIEVLYPALRHIDADIILEMRLDDNPYSSQSPYEISISNSFFGINPELRYEIHPLLNNDGAEICIASDKTDIWWKCQCAPDHVWPTTPNARHHSNTGCWYCAAGYSGENSGENQGVSISNSIAAHPAFEQTMWGNNPGLYPELIRRGVSRVQPNWACEYHDDWSAKPNNRLNQDGSLGSGCPLCSQNTNVSETRMRDLIADNFPWLEPTVGEWVPGWRHQDSDRLMRFDVGLRADIPFVIEYQGEQHDQAIEFFTRPGDTPQQSLTYRQSRDNNKRLMAESQNPAYTIIEVWYNGSPSAPTNWDHHSVESLLAVFASQGFDPYEFETN